jgi:hypothetical protein
MMPIVAAASAIIARRFCRIRLNMEALRSMSWSRVGSGKSIGKFSLAVGRRR